MTINFKFLPFYIVLIEILLSWNVSKNFSYEILLSTFFLSTECKKLNKANHLESVNPLTTNVPHHIETSQLICIVNQVTGFYMMGNIGR